MRNSNRILAFDYLRIIAAFTVVVLHVSAPIFIESFPSREWNIANFYEALVRWNVPIFIMISGALFLNQDKKIEIRRLYTKNILRIVVVLLFWSVIYAFPKIMKGCNINYLITYIITGPYHFWFLKVLLGLYIAIPIYKHITTNKKIESYFLVIAFITGIFLPSFFSIVGMFNMQVKEMLVNIYKSVGIEIASTFSFYFVIGHYLAAYPISKYRKLLYLLGCSSVVFCMLLTYYCSHKTGEPVVLFLSNSCLFTMIEAAAIYVFFTSCNFSIGKSNTMVDKLSRNSFGIYIMHVFVLGVLYKFSIGGGIHPMLYIPLLSLLTFVISFILIEMLQKIPFINKWFF